MKDTNVGIIGFIRSELARCVSLDRIIDETRVDYCKTVEELSTNKPPNIFCSCLSNKCDTCPDISEISEWDMDAEYTSFSCGCFKQNIELQTKDDCYGEPVVDKLHKIIKCKECSNEFNISENSKARKVTDLKCNCLDMIRSIPGDYCNCTVEMENVTFNINNTMKVICSCSECTNKRNCHGEKVDISTTFCSCTAKKSNAKPQPHSWSPKSTETVAPCTWLAPCKVSKNNLSSYRQPVELFKSTCYSENNDDDSDNICHCDLCDPEICPLKSKTPSIKESQHSYQCISKNSKCLGANLEEAERNVNMIDRVKRIVTLCKCKICECLFKQNKTPLCACTKDKEFCKCDPCHCIACKLKIEKAATDDLNKTKICTCNPCSSQKQEMCNCKVCERELCQFCRDDHEIVDKRLGCQFDCKATSVNPEQEAREICAKCCTTVNVEILDHPHDGKTAICLGNTTDQQLPNDQLGLTSFIKNIYNEFEKQKKLPKCNVCTCDPCFCCGICDGVDKSKRDFNPCIEKHKPDINKFENFNTNCDQYNNAFSILYSSNIYNKGMGTETNITTERAIHACKCLDKICVNISETDKEIVYNKYQKYSNYMSDRIATMIEGQPLQTEYINHNVKNGSNTSMNLIDINTNYFNSKMIMWDCILDKSVYLPMSNVNLQKVTLLSKTLAKMDANLVPKCFGTNVDLMCQNSSKVYSQSTPIERIDCKIRDVVCKNNASTSNIVNTAHNFLNIKTMMFDRPRKLDDNMDLEKKQKGLQVSAGSDEFIEAKGSALETVFLETRSNTKGNLSSRKNQKISCSLSNYSDLDHANFAQGKIIQSNKNSQIVCEDIKPSGYLKIRKMSYNSLLVHWHLPNTNEIVGYELLINGVPVQKIFSPSKCTAVIRCPFHWEKVTLAVKNIMANPDSECSQVVTDYDLVEENL